MEVQLKDFLKEHSQAELAKALNVTAGAVYQWVKFDRDIRIKKHKNGTLSAYQVKPVGRKQSA